MNTDYEDIKYKELTEKIINIFYRVYNKLGYGFLEKVYEDKSCKKFSNREYILVIKLGCHRQ